MTRTQDDDCLQNPFLFFRTLQPFFPIPLSGFKVVVVVVVVVVVHLKGEAEK